MLFLLLQLLAACAGMNAPQPLPETKLAGDSQQQRGSGEASSGNTGLAQHQQGGRGRAWLPARFSHLVKPTQGREPPPIPPTGPGRGARGPAPLLMAEIAKASWLG